MTHGSKNIQDKLKTYVIALLITTTLTDLIQGTSKDILTPIVSMFIPGHHSRPVRIFGVELYLTRYVLRLFNFVFGVYMAYLFMRAAESRNMPAIRRAL